VKSNGDMPSEDILVNDVFADYGFEALSRRGLALRKEARRNNAELARGPPVQKVLDRMAYLSNFSKEIVDLSMLKDARAFLQAALLDASNHLGAQCPGGVGEDCGVGGLGFSAVAWTGAYGVEKPWLVVTGLTLRNATWSHDCGLALAPSGSFTKAPALALFPAALKSLPGALWSVAPAAPKSKFPLYLAPVFQDETLVLAVHLPSQDFDQEQCLLNRVELRC
jgi:hypothetical protein